MVAGMLILLMIMIMMILIIMMTMMLPGSIVALRSAHLVKAFKPHSATQTKGVWSNYKLTLDDHRYHHGDHCEVEENLW